MIVLANMLNSFLITHPPENLLFDKIIRQYLDNGGRPTTSSNNGYLFVNMRHNKNPDRLIDVNTINRPGQVKKILEISLSFRL
jgi:hypothetical protein